MDVKKERSLAFKIRQNVFPAGAPPQTPLGNSRRSPDPQLSGEGDTPFGAFGTYILRFGGITPKYFW